MPGNRLENQEFTGGVATPRARMRRRVRAARLTFPILAALMLMAGPALAQQAPPPPSPSPGFDPLQTERRFDAWQAEQSRARPPVRLPHLAAEQPPASPKPLFVLKAVAVSGVHALPPEQIAATWQPYVGKKVSQADLAAITTAISDLYRSAGYELSRAIVPPQDIQGGRVRINVIEGSIAEVVLNGDNIARFGLPAMLEPVRREHPARLRTLERQLLLINDRPGVRVVDTALEEIGRTSGRFRLVVFVKTWSVFTSFGIDNLGSSAVGPWQSYATAAFNSYLTPGDSLVANLSTIPADPRELAFGRLSYDVPVGTDGFKLGASALYSVVRPGDERAQADDKTRTNAFEVRGSFVPIESLASALTLTAAVGITNASESDNFGPYYSDHIRTVSLSADYRLRDALGGNNYLTLLWRQGLDVFGATHADDTFSSRDGATPTFSVFDGWFTRIQPLSENWSVKFAAAGQLATAPLFISQQFYLGGAAFGRGYGNAEISGDNGLAGTFELRFDQNLDARYLKGYELYSFVDTGAVWNYGFTINDGAALTSVGGGLRLFFGDDLKADVGVALPLTYAGPDNLGRSPRLLFSLSSSFHACPEHTAMRCM